MKKQVLSLIALVTLVIAPVSAVYADGNRLIDVNHQMRVDIAFEFMVGAKTLPAGQYQVKLNPSQDSLTMSGTEKGATACALTMGGKSNQAETSARLVFHRYGDTYFLAEVWEADSHTPRQLPESSVERKLRKQHNHLADVAQAEIITITAQ